MLFSAADQSIALQLLIDSYPVMVSSLCTFGIIDFILFFFVGKLQVANSIDVFAGVSLAQMFGNVTCLSLLWGLASAVETLGSQANGAGRYREVGIILQRSVLLVGLSAVPLACVWLSAPALFRHFGIASDVCDIVRVCLHVRLFELPGNVIICSFECFLTAIGTTTPLLYANVTLNLVFALFCYISVFVFEWSYVSIAWSHVAALYCCLLVEMVLAFGHVRVRDILLRKPLCWCEATCDLHACATFMGLGLYGAIMLCCEWWAYELLTMFAGFLGTPEVAAQSIIFATINIVYSVPYGLGSMVTSGIGNHLGRGEVHEAGRLAYVAYYLVAAVESLLSLGVYCFCNQYLHLYTSDLTVLQITVDTIPLVAALVVCDGLQTMGSSILKGAGKQDIGAAINFMSFYVIGVPLSWYTCFHNGWGVTGLVFGMTVANLLQVVLHASMFWAWSDYIFVHNEDLLVEDDGCLSIEEGQLLMVGGKNVPYTSIDPVEGRNI